MEEGDKGCPMIRTGVSGWMFLLVPAYPGSPGRKAVKRLCVCVCVTVKEVVPSVLWRCWLGGRKGIRPVKNWVVGCWYGYLSGVRCRLAYSPADATATHSHASVKSRLVLSFWYRLTRAVLEKGLLNGCVCVIVKEVCLQCLTLLVGHQEEHPDCKNWVMRCWCGYLSGVRCRLFAYGPADATAISKPHHLLPHLNPDWFYLFGTGLPRLSWKKGR